MVDINLLPEEMRRKEKEEKPRPRPRVIEIEVTKPPVEQKSAPQRAPALPLWTKILGTPEEQEAKRKARLDSAEQTRQAQEEKKKQETERRNAEEQARQAKLLAEQKTAEEKRKTTETARLAAEAQARQATLTQTAAETEKRRLVEETQKAKIVAQEQARIALEAKSKQEAEGQKRALETARQARLNAEEQIKKDRILAEQKRAAPKEAEAAKVTLLPSKVTPLTALPARALPLLLPFLISFGIFALLGGGIFAITQSIASSSEKLSLTRDSLKNQIQKDEAGLSQAFILQRQMVAAERLLREHHYLTSFLAFLETHTLPDVSYSKLVFTEGKKVNGSVLANSFARAGEQLLLLLQARELLADITFSRFAREKTDYGEKVRFDIDGVVTPKALLK